MLKLRKLLPDTPRLHRRLTATGYLRHSDIVVHRDTVNNNEKTPFEFTEANMTRLTALMKNYPAGAQRSALGGAIDIVQRQIGWVPISAMNKIADLLCVPRIRVYEYATFHSMVKRRFRGKYNVKVCSTTPCMLRGSEIILKAVEECCCCSVGNVSVDGMFGVDIVECSGACANAPVMVIDDDYYEDLKVSDVFNIIQQIRNGFIPPPGPRSGRFAAEPITGLTSLLTPPQPPGYGLQRDLWDDKIPCP